MGNIMGQRSEVGIVLSKRVYEYIQTVELANRCFDDCDYHFISDETKEHLFIWESVKWNDSCPETWAIMRAFKDIDGGISLEDINGANSCLDAGDYLFIKLDTGLQELGARYRNYFNFKYIGGCHTLGFYYKGITYNRLF